MKTKTKKVNWLLILICIAAFLLLQWLFIGYRFNFGPFKSLGDIRMGRIEGNTAAYSMEHVSLLEGNPLQGGKCVLSGLVCHLRCFLAARRDS